VDEQATQVGWFQSNSTIVIVTSVCLTVLVLTLVALCWRRRLMCCRSKASDSSDTFSDETWRAKRRRQSVELNSPLPEGVLPRNPPKRPGPGDHIIT
jgi:hypothetical protein